MWLSHLTLRLRGKGRVTASYKRLMFCESIEERALHLDEFHIRVSAEGINIATLANISPVNQSVMYKIFQVALVISAFGTIRWVWPCSYLPMFMANILSSTLAKSFCKCRKGSRPDNLPTEFCCTERSEDYPDCNLVYSVGHHRVCRVLPKSLYQRLTDLLLSVIAKPTPYTIIRAYGLSVVRPRTKLTPTTVY